MNALHHNGILNRTVQYLRACYALDARSLALFRVAVAIVLLADLMLRFQHITVFYADQGAFPRRLAMAAISEDRWSVLFLNGTTGFAITVLTIGIVSAIAMLVGFHTRLATVVLWVVVVSIQARNNHVLSGADTLMRVTMFWAMFLPLGSRYSFDARGVEAGEAGNSRIARFASVASFGLIVQIACLYFFTALQKSGDKWHADANAVYYALGARDLSNNFGDWLFHSAPDAFFTAATRGTIIIEYAIPLLLLLPVRNGLPRGAALICMILLQVGIATTMTVGLFPYISIAAGLVVVPSGFWDFAESRRPQLTPIRTLVQRLEHRLDGLFPREQPTPHKNPPSPSGYKYWPKRAVLVDVVASIAVILVVMWNATTVSSMRAPEPVRRVAVVAGLFQNWSMFAPNPQGSTHWYIVEGTLASGEEIDVLVPMMEGDLTIREGVVWDQSDALVIKDKYWRKYFQQIRDRDSDLLAFTGYVCRTWNNAHSDGERLERIGISRGSSATFAMHNRAEPEFTSIGSWTCN